METVERNGVLSESQQGFRGHRGTHTANPQLKNALEAAWQRKTKIYGSSWDISKAFDSVSHPLVRMAWERVWGVPDTIIEWLMELDRDNHTIVWSNWAMEVWEQDGYAGIANDGLPEHVCYINPERGTGQGDVSSPQTWVVFFYIIPGPWSWKMRIPWYIYQRIVLSPGRQT